MVLRGSSLGERSGQSMATTVNGSMSTKAVCLESTVILHPHVQLQCHISPRRRNQRRARQAAAAPRAERWRRIPARLLQDVPSQLHMGLARNLLQLKNNFSPSSRCPAGPSRPVPVELSGPFSRGTAAGQSCRFLGCRLHFSLR